MVPSYARPEHQSPTPTTLLCIIITKGAADGTHELGIRLWAPGRQQAQIDRIRNLKLRARRVILRRTRAGHGVLPVAGILTLPDGPQTIDLGVVQEKYGIAGAGEGIAHVTPGAEVAHGVGADMICGGTVLECPVEGRHVGLLEQFGD